MKDERVYSIILAHTVSPLNGLEFRKKELNLLAGEAEKAPRPFVLFGDLNCGPFSPYFENLLELGDLKDTENGYGLQCTWPAFAIPFVPIDHVLVSKDLICSERVVGPQIGSDHMPVFVKLEAK